MTTKKKIRKEANEIKEIKVNSNEKIKTLAEEGYRQKEMENLNIEWQKLNDLEFLKKQDIPGPFTSPRDVEKLMRTEPESENENDYYIEN